MSMMKLQRNETLLVGDGELVEKRVRTNSTEDRIEWLIANSLERVASTGSGWEILYQDRADDRYWELTFPRSEMQGGGPRTLRCIERSEAENKYGIPALER